MESDGEREIREKERVREEGKQRKGTEESRERKREWSQRHTE